MSQISLKSISGITSITTPAGVDNQFTLHTNNTSQALKLDSAGNIHIHNHVNTTGVSTASNFKTGTSNLHGTGLTVGDSFLHSTGINLGTGVTFSNNGNATFSGIITATQFKGDGSQLSGIDTDLVSDTSPQLGGDLQSNGSDIDIADNDRIYIGTDNDTQIYDNNVNTYIDSNLHKLRLQVGDNRQIILEHRSDGDYMALFKDSGSVDLYYSGSKKFETTNTGVTVTGTVTATSFSGSGANLTGISSPLSFRNLIINGAMSVSQRGTSFASTLSEAQYTIDRFAHSIRGTNDSYYYQVSDSPDDFNKSMKVKCNSTYTPSGSDNAGFITSLEGQDLQELAFGTSSAKSITISFYAKSASQNNGHQYSFQIRTAPSGGGNRTVTNSFTVTSSWQRFSFTFAGDTGADIRNDTAVGMQLIWWLDAGPTDIISQITSFTSSGSYRAVTGQDHFLNNTSNEFYITGCQLEVGTVATPFEHRSVADELTRCQRYYFAMCTDTYEILGTGHQYYSGNIFIPVYFPTTMRAEPTLEALAGGSGAYVYEKLFGNSAQYHHQISQETGKTGHNQSCIIMSGDASRQGQTVRCAAHSFGSNTQRFVAFQAEL